jgi:putative membrane protein
MAVFRLVVTLVVMFVLVIFGVKNMESVSVNYLWGTVNLPMFLLMAVLVLVGAVISAFVGLTEQFRLNARLKNQARRIKDLERELASLRGFPTTDNAAGQDDKEDGFDE